MIFRKEVLRERLVEMNQNPPKRSYLTDAPFRVISKLVELADEDGRVPLTKAVALFPEKNEKAAMNKIRQACHHFNRAAKRAGVLFSVKNQHGTRAPLNAGFLVFLDITAIVEDFTLAQIGDHDFYIAQPAMILDTTKEDGGAP